MTVISSNNAANAAIIYLNHNTGTEATEIAQLASGNRIVQAADDPSGLAIGAQISAQAVVFGQDATNIQQGDAILQSADGALAQVSNVLQRMMALATESASGQVTNTQRGQDINTEYQQLRTELSSIVNSTTYAGQKLLSGSFLSNVRFLVGTASADYITVSVMTLSVGENSGLLGTASTISTAATGLAGIDQVNSALIFVGTDRARIGSYEAQFNFGGANIESNVQNTTAAASVVLDADVASVKAHLAAADVTTHAAVAALTQASALPQELLRLVQS